MNVTNEEETFLKDLVKASRQKIHQVKWVDRDGSQRLTVLSQAESTKLNAIARFEKVSAAEVLRQAAHIPVSKPAAKAKDVAPTPDDAAQS